MESLKENIDILKDGISKFDVSKYIEKLGPLHRAVFDGDIVKLEELLRHGEDGDDEDGTPFNYTAAHWAAVRCDDEILNLLNDFGTNMSAVDGTDLRPLHVASLAGNSAALIWLLENTYDIESTDIYQQTPLHQAVLNGHLQAVKILVDHGASMEATDEFGMTPICLAASRGFSHIVHFLLEEGANPDVRDIDGKTLLHASSALNDVSTLVLLLKTGINVNAKDNKNSTALHDAARNGCSETISLLLKYGADKEVTDLDGCTPLNRAKEAGHKKSIEILMEEEQNETAILKDEYNDMQVVSTTSCVEPNLNDTLLENSLQVDSTTSYLEPNLFDSIIKNSDCLDENGAMEKKDYVAKNDYCNDGCSLYFDDSGDEERFELQLDFSALTVDDINKIIL